MLSLARETGNLPVRIFSFELKRALAFTNLREAFFQAVSNSSWANEGFLVAANIDKDEDLHTELRRLSTAFGIGIIQLDIDEPDASEILFPARFKDILDWETINKLAEENPDFTEFIKRVKTDIASNEVRKEAYDSVLSAEEITSQIRSKK